MKKLIYLFLTLLMTSCATTFYQVYNVKPNQEKNTKTDNLFFEDENCKITYDLWANGGNIGFDIYNKTDENVYVYLNESNFILNGFAYDYYKNRTFTTTEGTIKEDSIIRIPAKTTKRISEYSINSTRITDCDLKKYPSRKTIKTKSYSIEQSPIIFSNIITYESKGERIIVQNEFYVSEIANYPDTEFFEYKYTEYCGKKSMSKTKFYKFYNTDKFYIKYN
tara:strand:+ start:104 stop:769 length:666 start_codon:yes stop_codon:yes gene_type:complete